MQIKEEIKALDEKIKILRIKKNLKDSRIYCFFLINLKQILNIENLILKLSKKIAKKKSLRFILCQGGNS